MKSLKLDKNTHDLVFENGELLIVEDTDGNPEQIVQNLRTRLLFFRGEWFLDTSVGLPYFTDIMVKSPNIPHIEAVIKLEILEVSGVLEITQFDLNFDIAARKMTINFAVSTMYGNAQLTETI